MMKVDLCSIDRKQLFQVYEVIGRAGLNVFLPAAVVALACRVGW